MAGGAGGPCSLAFPGRVSGLIHPSWGGRQGGPALSLKGGVERTDAQQGVEPGERDDPFTYQITYQIITFYRAVTLRCRAAAETKPRTDIESRPHSNSTSARTAQTL